MNNSGWSLNEFLMGMGVLTFALILSVIIYDAKVKSTLSENKKDVEKSTYTYEDMENKLIEGTMRYIEKEYKEIPSSEIKVDMDTLLENNLYHMDKDPEYPNYKCDGYVIFNKNKNSFSYKPYIKCKEYMTKGYNVK